MVATLGFGLRSILLQVDLMERQASLDQLARQDGLTGVANRREFDALLLAEWNRARRSGTELGLLLLDIDHFGLQRPPRPSATAACRPWQRY